MKVNVMDRKAKRMFWLSTIIAMEILLVLLLDDALQNMDNMWMKVILLWVFGAFICSFGFASMHKVYLYYKQPAITNH